ncbi:MAG: hypothetical protein QG568_648 [Patescibacteria group bacterium]|nr:hypothetical protein [Patescibacteria group bacterium]
MRINNAKTTMIHIKADPRVKDEVYLIIDEMGLTLSAVVNAFLKQLIRTREVSFSAGNAMTPYMQKVIKDARSDVNRYKFRAMPFEDLLNDDLLDKS